MKRAQTLPNQLLIKLILLLALFVSAQSLVLSHFHVDDVSPSHNYELCDLLSMQHNLQGVVSLTGIFLPISHAVPPVDFLKPASLFLSEYPAYFLRAPPKTG